LETHRSSIVKRVIDGSVTIQSVEEFENIVRIFPDDPSVYRAYADLLVRKQSFKRAARAYREASRLYLDMGMVLQAMVSKILEWRIVKPSHEEGRAFHKALQFTTPTKRPLGKFFVGMTYPELVAFMVRLVRKRFSEGKIVKKGEENDASLFFVVSGRLRQTTYEDFPEGKGGKKRATTDLVKNDFFGTVYPFFENVPAALDVETITRTELVKISRDKLQEICDKYPNMAHGIKALCASYSLTGKNRPSKNERKTVRHLVPVSFQLKIFSEETDHEPFLVKGVTQDISLGGVCLWLGAEAGTQPSKNWVGKSVWIAFDLPQVDREIKIFGTIVWSREILERNALLTALGIHFSKLSDQDKMALDEYCHHSEGEQKLMWRLWESYTDQTQDV
jgi:CRP-like cAMP-binding protein